MFIFTFPIHVPLWKLGEASMDCVALMTSAFFQAFEAFLDCSVGRIVTTSLEHSCRMSIQSAYISLSDMVAAAHEITARNLGSYSVANKNKLVCYSEP